MLKWRLGLRSGYNVNTVYQVDETVEAHAEGAVASVYGIPMHCSQTEVVSHQRITPTHRARLQRALLIGELIAAAPDMLRELWKLYEHPGSSLSPGGRRLVERFKNLLLD